MEDYAGYHHRKRPSANSIIDLQSFTLIGATKGQGSCPPAARAFRMTRGSICTQCRSFRRSSSAQGDTRGREPGGAAEIAARSEDSPHKPAAAAHQDYAQVRAEGVITREVADEAEGLK